MKKVIALVREIKVSKDVILDYLKSIGIEDATINTALNEETVAKVYSNFRKEIELEDKKMEKSVKFVEKFHVELSDAQEKIDKENEEKRLLEEQERLRKVIEEEQKTKEEERKKQELLAYRDRAKTIKDQEQKEKDKRIAKKTATAAPKFTKKTPDKPAADSDIKRNKTLKQGEKPKPVSSDDKSKPAGSDIKPVTSSAEDKPKTSAPQQGFDRTEKGEAQKTFKKPFDRNKKKLTEKITIDQVIREKKKQKSTQKPEPTGDKKEQKKEVFVKRNLTDKLHEDRKFRDKKDRDKKKFESESERKRRIKSEKGHREKDATQKEIDEAIRETYAKIEGDTGSSARSIARKRKKKERIEEEKKILELKEATKNVIKVNEFLSTAELANLMGIDSNEIIKNCFKLGIMVSINQRLEKDIIELISSDFGFKIEFTKEYEEDIIEEQPDRPEDLTDRAPVVTIMGHVDHGKTSLLDYIRKTNVVAGEAGGITQHIGAYKVRMDSGKEISFLDTPGHEAFTAMRARGGQAADIVVLVVAADDNVMPQTIEAINHARAANVPIIIAINKVDKPDSNSDRIRQQLSEKDVLVEEWGGKYQSVEISAKMGMNIDKLLEKILVEAELLELKTNLSKSARGVVLEAKLDKGRGPIATVLVQKGVLRIGDSFIAGIYSGKVRAMFDEREHALETAASSTPVVVLGFDGVPQAGDTFVVLENERDTKNLSLKRQQLKREQDFRQVKFVTLDDISKQIQEGRQVELKIILKADTDGSAEALADSLHKLTTSETKVSVIHKAVGTISESDILLAEASGAIVIGFSVRPNLKARKLAEKNKIDIRLYTIIYTLIDEIKTALEGMLAPDISEEVTATVEVRQIFKVPKIGNIAGCYVQDGKINRNNKVRLLRDGFQIFNGGISSLKREKDDVREVESGYECGIGLENFNDIKVGDIIEAFKIVETKRKLVTPQ
ncbi:MAG TPA: translation initiation factor IF-2 [Ignavibacteria bacterium]|nr:translation initiation factor IF-2 [Bacteroidota bacterium]HRI84478.1 translation initiation factor IF-2 [Ignavibacteria bacterium]HRJ98860.1 translation initiation factor IF-2 [Ignavibacteria bacterium]